MIDLKFYWGVIFMANCNLRMDDNCYGCQYYALGDVEGCKLTIKFHKKFPNHTDMEHKQYMINNGRRI